MTNKRTRFILMMIALSLASILQAQTDMRIHYKDGTQQDIPISSIDSVSFVKDTTVSDVVSLTGGWLWGSNEMGYYEVLTFMEDHTFTGYDNYFSIGFDTMTYGFYQQFGSLLTLWSNGFGYQHRYNWFINVLTENALTVMTRMGSFTYFKLQPETIQMKVGESLTCEDGDVFVFADGKVARIEGNRLTAMLSGVTYIQLLNVVTNRILAYKIIVD